MDMGMISVPTANSLMLPSNPPATMILPARTVQAGHALPTVRLAIGVQVWLTVLYLITLFLFPDPPMITISVSETATPQLASVPPGITGPACHVLLEAGRKSVVVEEKVPPNR